MNDEDSADDPADWLATLPADNDPAVAAMIRRVNEYALGIPAPRAGDVIFTYSADRGSYESCVAQHALCGAESGWFSHVATAVSPSTVIEAALEPIDPAKTWSGTAVGRGVRLRLIPDLILRAAAWRVLRHPSADDFALHFGMHLPDFLATYGAGYSSQALVVEIAQRHQALATHLDERFNWRAAPDETIKELRNDPNLLAEIAHHLPAGMADAMKADYFCSQLVGILLNRRGLVSQDLGLITPCGLFGDLTKAGWKDVTESDYGHATQERWERIAADIWQINFVKDVSLAAFMRNQLVMTGRLGALSDKFKTSLWKYFDDLKE